MKTLIVNVPDKHKLLIQELFEKLRLRSHELSDEDMEDFTLAEKINEGMKTEDVSEEEIFEIFRKNGIKI